MKIFTWTIEKLNYIKTFFTKKNSQVAIRGTDKLFETGEIFDATKEELEKIIREAATRAIPNPLARDREVIRALVVNNIQNQRHIDKIDSRNTIYTWIIITLTLISISMTYAYSRIQIAPILEAQDRNNRRAYEMCKNSSNLDVPLTDGTIITCPEFLKMFKGKYLD